MTDRPQASPQPLEAAWRSGNGRAEAARRPPLLRHPLRHGLLLLALGLVLWLAEPAWSALRAAALVAEITPSSLHPLQAWTAAPRLEPVRYRLGSETIEADLYLPAGGGKHAAIVLQGGVANVGRRFPALAHLGESFARAGVAALIPDSPDMLSGRFTPRDIDRLETGISYLMRRSDINADRVGLFGLSVGGDIAVLSAADGRAGSRLRFVATSGLFFSLEHMLQIATTSTYPGATGVRPFPVAPWVWLVVRNTAISAVPDADDRAKLLAVFPAEIPRDVPQQPPGLTPGGQAMFALLANRDPRRVQPLFQALPPVVRDWLLALSPAAHLSRVGLPLLLMVDEDDGYIPSEESRRLAAALPGRASLTVMHVLHHVELTTNPRFNPSTLRSFYLPEFSRLWWYAYRMLHALS